MGALTVHAGAHPRVGCMHAHCEHVHDHYLQKVHGMQCMLLQVADMPSASPEDAFTASAPAAFVDVSNIRIAA